MDPKPGFVSTNLTQHTSLEWVFENDHDAATTYTKQSIHSIKIKPWKVNFWKCPRQGQEF
jgi:hypothetical protein